MCGAAHIISPSSEKSGQLRSRACHGRYLVRDLAAAREVNVVRDMFSFLVWSVLHYGY